MKLMVLLSSEAGVMLVTFAVNIPQDGVLPSRLAAVLREIPSLGLLNGH